MSKKNRELKAIRRAIREEGVDPADTIYALPTSTGEIQVAAYCGRARYRCYKERARAGLTPIPGKE